MKDGWIFWNLINILFIILIYGCIVGYLVNKFLFFFVFNGLWVLIEVRWVDLDVYYFFYGFFKCVFVID